MVELNHFYTFEIVISLNPKFKLVHIQATKNGQPLVILTFQYTSWLDKCTFPMEEDIL